MQTRILSAALLDTKDPITLYNLHESEEGP